MGTSQFDADWSMFYNTPPRSLKKQEQANKHPGVHIFLSYVGSIVWFSL